MQPRPPHLSKDVLCFRSTPEATGLIDSMDFSAFLSTKTVDHAGREACIQQSGASGLANGEEKKLMWRSKEGSRKCRELPTIQSLLDTTR